MKLIRGEIRSRLTVAAIAQKIGCSARLLEKDFKDVLGRSVIHEMGEVRMTKVLDLLKRTAKSEEDIAAECGYGSPGTLRNAFRAQFGTTMRAWRASALD
jgi:transcriptional regulator GlxA family with amidase domain